MRENHTGKVGRLGMPLCVLVMMFFTASSTAHGQNGYLGVTAGGTRASLVGDDLTHLDRWKGASDAPRYGFKLGPQFLIEGDVTPMFGLGASTGLVYTQKGHRLVDERWEDDLIIKGNYIEVPFHGKLTADWTKSPISVHALLGLTLQKGLEGETTDPNVESSRNALENSRLGVFSAGLVNSPDSGSVLLGSLFGNLNVGLVGGVGIDISLGPGLVTFDVRYTRSLFTDDSFYGLEHEATVFNSVFSANAGYVFPLF